MVLSLSSILLFDVSSISLTDSCWGESLSMPFAKHAVFCLCGILDYMFWDLLSWPLVYCFWTYLEVFFLSNFRISNGFFIVCHMSSRICTLVLKVVCMLRVCSQLAGVSFLFLLVLGRWFPNCSLPQLKHFSWGFDLWWYTLHSTVSWDFEFMIGHLLGEVELISQDKYYP